MNFSFPHNAHSAHKPYKPYKAHKPNRPHSPHHLLLLLSIFQFFNLSILLSSCEKAEQPYSNILVRLTLSATNLIPQLNSSLNNPGEFCTITAHNNTYVFHSPGLREDYVHELTELERKSNFVLGLSGLIVGTPIMAEQLSTQANVVCYDLACANCYEEASITRNLTLRESQRAECSRCGRRYDLNTQGIVIDGPTGRSLFRYRATFYPSGNTLTVSN